MLELGGVFTILLVGIPQAAIVIAFLSINAATVATDGRTPIVAIFVLLASLADILIVVVMRSLVCCGIRDDGAGLDDVDDDDGVDRYGNRASVYIDFELESDGFDSRRSTMAPAGK